MFQTGSGTQSNMNANEVIARRAGQMPAAARAIHPNDDVNRSQSSNDAFPAVMHIAAVEAIEDGLLPAVGANCATRSPSAAAPCADIVMIGRTHLMDATPLTMGQLFSGWIAQLDQAAATIRSRARRALRIAARRHRGRHRAQRAAAVRRAGRAS